jgi:hypothetical protein
VRQRFLETDDQQQLAMIENSLAYIRSLQLNFRSAEKLYDEALRLSSCALLFRAPFVIIRF